MSFDVAPVAASFLERLLFDTEALEAISTLSNIWQVRAMPDLPQFGLSKPEYQVQLCLVYTGEVGNGGHEQFFLNRGGRYLGDTVHALLATGLVELAATLRSAIATFPDGHVTQDLREIERAFDLLPSRDIEKLADLDKQAFKLLPLVYSQLLSYIRENRSQVLLPETPQAVRIGRSVT